MHIYTFKITFGVLGNSFEKGAHYAADLHQDIFFLNRVPSAPLGSSSEPAGRNEDAESRDRLFSVGSPRDQ